MSDRPQPIDRLALGADLASSAAGAAAGVYLNDPFLAAAGAAAGVVAREAATAAIRRLGGHQRRRAEAVLVVAADAAGLDVDELVARLQASPEGEELLLLTMRTAWESATANRLFALAGALAAASTGQSAPSFETLFVRAAADCDVAHITVLQCFLRSAADLGLGTADEPDFQRPTRTLNSRQLELVLPDLVAVLDPLLSVLQRHGLVAPLTAAGGGSYGGGGPARPISTWQITTFGEAAARRLAALASVLADVPEDEDEAP